MASDEDINAPTLTVVFYRTNAGREPVRDWLKSLKRQDRKIIGEDIKTAQHGFIKKSQNTRREELEIARKRLADLEME